MKIVNELVGRAKNLERMQTSKLRGKEWHEEFSTHPISRSIRRHKHKTAKQNALKSKMN
jgi:hypothetical protein